MATINNAWLNMEERTKGSIEPGKFADLVILNEDPLDLPRAAPARCEGADDDGRRQGRRRATYECRSASTGLRRSTWYAGHNAATAPAAANTASAAANAIGSAFSR